MNGCSCVGYAPAATPSTDPTSVPFARRPRWRHFVHVLLLLCLGVMTAESALPDVCADGVSGNVATDAALHPGSDWVIEAADRDHGPASDSPGGSSFPARDHCSHAHGQGTLLARALDGVKLPPPAGAPSEQMRVPDSPVLDQRLRPPLG